MIGLLLGLLVLRWVRSRAAQYAPIYQEAQENLVSKTMEYIRGISVLRSFSKGEEGQREVRSAFQKKVGCRLWAGKGYGRGSPFLYSGL